MAITIRFVNRNVNAEGIRVYKSAVSFTTDNLPPVHSTLPGNAIEFVDPAVTRGETCFYVFETFLDEDSTFSPIVYAEALPVETGPGPQILIGGDNWAGFFGEIPASEFITGDKLAAYFGLTAGSAQHSGEPWLKFVFNGRTLFVSRKSFRHTITWDQINIQNLVYGDRAIEVQGDTYTVRLLKGAASDPISGAPTLHDPEQSWGSEWNRLLYPLVPNPSNVPTHPVSQEGVTYGEWANYTETELNLGLSGGDGRLTVCQEAQGNTRVQRGWLGLSAFGLNTSSGTNSLYGWRPVLELTRHGDTFLGEVASTDLISGDALASQIGLTAGTPQYSDIGWLKYLTRDGKTLYVAKRPLRHSVSWDRLNIVKAVYGNSTVYINDRKYKVRLLKGSNTNPTPGGNGYDLEKTWDSEWNRLLYPLIKDISEKAQIPTFPVSGEGLTFGSWANYTEADLVVNSSGGNGSYSWCQETIAGNPSYRVVRGYTGLSHCNLYTSSGADSVCGWRPVLELVE